MPNANSTLIVGILDRSGSMENIAKETVSGWNSFVSDQSKLPGECLVSLALFDAPGQEDWFHWVYENKVASNVVPLDKTSYVPRGGTALWASMIRAIDRVGELLSAMPEKKRPGKVVFVTMTDGEENSSHYAPEFAKWRVANKKSLIISELKRKIDLQTNVYNWQFTFLGANQDAILNGGQMGMSAVGCLNLSGSSESITNAYRSMTNSVCSYRSGASSGVVYTEKDRSAAMV